MARNSGILQSRKPTFFDDRISMTHPTSFYFDEYFVFLWLGDFFVNQLKVIPW